MKFFFLILSLILLSCNYNQNKEKKLIYDFVNEVVLKDNIKGKRLLNYLNYSKDIDTESLKEIIKELKTMISKDFVVLEHTALKKQNISIDFKFSDYRKVYHLVSNKKIVTTFVVDEGKIISFFYAIRKHKTDSLYPALLVID